VKDQIPGITTFLYEANRFRKPWEFEGYEEQVAKADAKFREELVLAGLPSTFTREDLLHQYRYLAQKWESKDQSYKLEELKQENLEYMTLVSKKTEEINTLQKSIYSEKNERSKYFGETITKEKEINELKTAMIKFGSHTTDCNYVDAVHVGRVNKKDTEHSLCDCGFSKLKHSILGIIPEEKKNEQAQEPLQDDSGDLE
jgi:vacuolar-type H+-ATPase subunit I/STV1